MPRRLRESARTCGSRRREQRVVAGVSLVDHGSVVRELAAVVLGHLRARAHQQGPVARTVVEVLLDPARGQPVGAPQAQPHHLAGVAVPGLQEPLLRAAPEPALHLDVGDDPAGAGEGVVPLPAADQHRLGALGHRHTRVVDAPADADVGSLPAQALVDRQRAVGRPLARVGLEVRETRVDRLGDGGVLLLEAALGVRSHLVGVSEVVEHQSRGATAAGTHAESMSVAAELGRCIQGDFPTVEPHLVAAAGQRPLPQPPRVDDQPQCDGAVVVGGAGDFPTRAGHGHRAGGREGEGGGLAGTVDADETRSRGRGGRQRRQRSTSYDGTGAVLELGARSGRPRRPVVASRRRCGRSRTRRRSGRRGRRRRVRPRAPDLPRAG